MTKELQAEYAEISAHLTEMREIFAAHILQKHSGVPVTTCHRCVISSTAIQSDLANLADIQHEIKASNSLED